MDFSWRDYVKAIAQSVRADAYAASVNGAGVDCSLASQVLWIIDVGAVTGSPTSFTVDVKVQDADDSAFTVNAGDAKDEAGSSVAAAQIVAQNQVVELSEKLHTREKTDAGAANRPSKRYRRAVATISFVGGASPKIPLAAHAVVLRGR